MANLCSLSRQRSSESTTNGPVVSGNRSNKNLIRTLTEEPTSPAPYSANNNIITNMTHTRMEQQQDINANNEQYLPPLNGGSGVARGMPPNRNGDNGKNYSVTQQFYPEGSTHSVNAGLGGSIYNNNNHINYNPSGGALLTTNGNIHGDSSNSLAGTTASPNTSTIRMSKFCHECGTRFIVDQAKFCIDCGVKRLIL